MVQRLLYPTQMIETIMKMTETVAETAVCLLKSANAKERTKFRLRSRLGTLYIDISFQSQARLLRFVEMYPRRFSIVRPKTCLFQGFVEV
jgi:hypothetical protein